MRYASIRKMDISNGEGIGVSLFVQGCDFHCHNCFNSETWDFNGGKEWTEKTENMFIELADKFYIKRISILGGEPLAEENVSDVLHLVGKIRDRYGNNKQLWLYTGYTWGEIRELTTETEIKKLRKKTISLCDILVDGPYIDALRIPQLKWRGSLNQRVIDIKNERMYQTNECV